MADPLLDQVMAEASERLGSYLGLGQLDMAAQAAVRDVLLDVVNRLSQRGALRFTDTQDLIQAAYEEMFGLGSLQQWADDPASTDIIVTGPRTGHVNRRGVWTDIDPGFESDDALLVWARRFAERHRRHVDHASPAADFDFELGRFHVIIPPAAGSCAQLSIRLLRLVGEELADLVRLGTMSREAEALLLAAVRAKVNIIISGGGGAGKTTMANALGRAIPRHERVVTIEDLAELRLASHLPKCSALFTRRANVEGRGEITIRHLIPEALRMCADRIIVGEVRGEEAGDVVDVMNTGHEGSFTSIHSNSGSEALSRLVILLGKANWPYEVAVRQVASTIALVVHMRKLPNGERVVETITDVDGAERTGVVRTTNVFERVDGELAFTGMPRPDRLERLVAAGWRPPTPVAVGEGRGW
jgi:pilus assembly protein CpaF